MMVLDRRYEQAQTWAEQARNVIAELESKATLTPREVIKLRHNRDMLDYLEVYIEARRDEYHELVRDPDDGYEQWDYL
jgi:hypothetical protein